MILLERHLMKDFIPVIYCVTAYIFCTTVYIVSQRIINHLLLLQCLLSFFATVNTAEAWVLLISVHFNTFMNLRVNGVKHYQNIASNQLE